MEMEEDGDEAGRSDGCRVFLNANRQGSAERRFRMRGTEYGDTGFWFGGSGGGLMVMFPVPGGCMPWRRCC